MEDGRNPLPACLPRPSSYRSLVACCLLLLMSPPPLSCCVQVCSAFKANSSTAQLERCGCAGASQRARRLHCRCRERVSRPPRAGTHSSRPAAESNMYVAESAMMLGPSEHRSRDDLLKVQRLAWRPVRACLRPRKVELLSARWWTHAERGRHWLLLSLALFPSLPPLIAHTTHTTAHFPLPHTPTPPFDSYAPVFRLPVRPTDHQTSLPSSLPPLHHPPPQPRRRTSTSTAPILRPPAHATPRHPHQYPSATT